MIDDETTYIVTRLDEVHGLGSVIPTYGAAATAIDQYRTVAVHETNLPELGAALTDVTAAASLAKIAEGGLSTYRELEAAETALQALLLHERVHVLTYAPKVDYGNGLVSYARQDARQRSDLAFQLMGLAGARDFIVAPEFLRVEDGRVISSTSRKSPLVGLMEHQLVQGRPYWSEDVEDAINVTIEMHGIPAYLTDPALVRTRLGEGFAKQFYTRIRQPWDQAVGQTPNVVCTFTLPPLLAIVLDRLNNRADLGTVIAELRDELAAVRRELLEFNQVVTASTTETEVGARVSHITESFNAIVPESRLTDVQRRSRKLMSIQKLVRPLMKFATGFVTKSGGTFEQALGAAGGAVRMVEESGALVDRTVTAQTFAGLLRGSEALQALVKYHLTQSEIAAIEMSMRKDRG